MEGSDETPDPFRRKVMGRKGIGKFSSFGIAREIEIESMQNGDTSRLVMNYDRMLANAANRSVEFPALAPTGDVATGTRVTLRKFTKVQPSQYFNSSAKAWARAEDLPFSVEATISPWPSTARPISPQERDLQSLLGRDADGNLYLWEYDDERLSSEEDWTVSGWIGALDRTTPNLDGIDRGIALMARGKLVPRTVCL